jgi:UDP-N-acetyl-D-glucosamine dehydrogenase
MESAHPNGTNLSRAPDGTGYAIPTAAQIAAHFADITLLAAGRPVVVVQGLGFVGSAVAAVIADARDAVGEPRWFVIGVDRATPGSWWKIALMNEGRAPIASPDPEFDRLVARGVLQTRNLFATASEEAYALAEVIVVDVHLDVLDRCVTVPDAIELNFAGFEAAIRAVGRHMRGDALVLVETTVPIGTCERNVLPALQSERLARGISESVQLAHAYERVMPGPRYIDSIRRFWRSFSAIDAASAVRAKEFLASFIDQEFAPVELADTASSELAKLLENSYRAANIAFIHEWTLLAEKIGINLWAVVDSIRVRKGTHDNLRYPGFGVGGYCLTKDSLLAQWSAMQLSKTNVLAVTLEALRINHDMPLHTLDLVRELAGGSVAGLRLLVCGISYLPNVADTRNSPTELFVDAATAEGADVTVHDPCVREWPERPAVRLSVDLDKALHHSNAIVFAVPHNAYKQLAPSDFPGARAIIDANNVLNDSVARSLHAAGSRLAGVGKGHWRKAGYHLKR